MGSAKSPSGKGQVKSGAVILEATKEAFITAGKMAAPVRAALLWGAGAASKEGTRKRRRRRSEVEAIPAVATGKNVMVVDVVSRSPDVQ